MRIVIHIGLHKTASTYLQHHIFPHLDEDRVVFNPHDLFYFINSIFTLDLKDDGRIAQARELARQYRSRSEGKTLLISSEAISQLSFTQNYGEHLKILGEIFEDAEIVLFLREQAAWFESCYKESIKHHFYQDAAAFLNYDGTAFRAEDARLNAVGFFSMDVHKADWSRLVEMSKSLFPKTHIFFYEEFRRDNLGETNRLLAILGHPPLSHVPQALSNPGLSSPSTRTLIKYHALLRAFGIRKRTYMDTFLRERKAVLQHDYFWTPGKPFWLQRLLRNLYKEPLRLLHRVSIYTVLRWLDRRHPERRKRKALSADMTGGIRSVHAASNSRLETVIGRAPPANYLAASPTTR